MKKEGTQVCIPSFDLLLLLLQKRIVAKRYKVNFCPKKDLCS